MQTSEQQARREALRKRRLEKAKKKSKRLLDKKEVLDRVKLSYPTVWQMMRDGKFPRSRQLGDQKVCWLESEIDDWIDGLPVQPLKGSDAHV